MTAKINSDLQNRNKQALYNTLIYDLVFILSKRVLKNYMNQITQEQKFVNILKDIFLQLSALEKKLNEKHEISIAIHQLMRYLVQKDNNQKDSKNEKKEQIKDKIQIKNKNRFNNQKIDQRKTNKPKISSREKNNSQKQLYQYPQNNTSLNNQEHKNIRNQTKNLFVKIKIKEEPPKVQPPKTTRKLHTRFHDYNPQRQDLPGVAKKIRKFSSLNKINRLNNLPDNSLQKYNQIINYTIERQNFDNSRTSRIKHILNKQIS